MRAGADRTPTLRSSPSEGAAPRGGAPEALRRDGGVAPLELLSIVLVAALLTLPGLGHRVFDDGDEARFALAAREILRGGSWLVPTVFGTPLVIKPPLPIWLIAASGWTFGYLDELTARLPSAVAAIVAVAILYITGVKLFGRSAGVLAGLLFASALGPHLYARDALPDMLMTAFSAVAVLAWIVAYGSSAGWAAPVFALALAVSFNFKLLAGVTAPIATVLGVALIRRDLHAIGAVRPLLASAIVLTGLAPFIVQAFLIPDFLRQVNAETFSGRAWNSWEDVWDSPLDALRWLAEAMVPWTVFLPSALLYVWRRRSRLRDDPALVPLVWFAMAVLSVMLVHTVRWRYLLPVLPPAVLLIARVWQEALAGRLTRAETRLLLAPLIGLSGVLVAGALGIIGGATPGVPPEVAGDLRRSPWVLVPALCGVAGVVVLFALRTHRRAALILCLVAGGIAVAAGEYVIGPFREPDRDPRQFAREVKRIAGERHLYYYGGDSFMAHFHWYADTPTTIVTTQDELLRAINEGSGYVLLPFAALDTLRQRHALDGRAAVVATADLGKRYHLILVRGGGGGTSAPSAAPSR